MDGQVRYFHAYRIGALLTVLGTLCFIPEIV
jgi:hypothetical protein